MSNAIKQSAILVFLLVLSLAGYIALGYFTERENFPMLIGLYGGLFAIYAVILTIWRPSGGILFGAPLVDKMR